MRPGLVMYVGFSVGLGVALTVASGCQGRSKPAAGDAGAHDADAQFADGIPSADGGDDANLDEADVPAPDDMTGTDIRDAANEGDADAAAAGTAGSGGSAGGSGGAGGSTSTGGAVGTGGVGTGGTAETGGSTGNGGAGGSMEMGGAGGNVGSTENDGGLDSSQADAPTITPCRPGDVALADACIEYCNTVTSACKSGDGGTNSQYPSRQACLDACNAPTWSCGTLDDTSGNTVWCRTNFAYEVLDDRSLAITECPWAGPTSSACHD